MSAIATVLRSIVRLNLVLTTTTTSTLNSLKWLHRHLKWFYDFFSVGFFFHIFQCWPNIQKVLVFHSWKITQWKWTAAMTERWRGRETNRRTMNKKKNAQNLSIFHRPLNFISSTQINQYYATRFLLESTSHDVDALTAFPKWLFSHS